MKAYTKQKMTRAQVARVLRSASAISDLARALGKHRVTVSAVLRGKTTSAGIMEAAEAKALEILSQREVA